MDWVLVESVGKNEYEGGLGQWESCGIGERAGSETSAVFKQ